MGCGIDHRFAMWAGGTPVGMSDSEGLPDDVPVADAVEQQRAASEPVLDEEAGADSEPNPPLEASPADWQEQLEAVEIDPEDDVAAE